MTVWPCPSQGVNCPNFDDSPLINNSSEAPDPFNYFGEAYGPTFVPPLGTIWGNPVGVATCYSTVSQEDADLCAMTTVNGPSGPPGTWMGPTKQPVPPHHSHFNQLLTVDAMCPDGSIYAYVVPAGMFAGATQSDANQAAIEWGMQQAAEHLLCLSELPPIVCQGAEMNLSVVATSNFLDPTQANQWFTTGTLPDGVIFTGPPSGPATLTGTPLTPGNFAFNIGITLPNGDNNQRFYAMTVAGITNATLPNATIGAPYSASLMTLGYSHPLFTLVSGSFPPGLSMDSFGHITGTPAGSVASYNPVMVVQDGISGLQCNQSVRITTVGGGINFNNLVWNNPPDANGTAGTGQLSNIFNLKDAFSASAAGSTDDFVSYAIYSNTGTLTWNGPPQNCNCNLSVLDLGGNGAADAYVQVVINGVTTLDVDASHSGPGIYPFIVPDGTMTPQVVQIQFDVGVDGQDGIPGNGSSDIAGTFGPAF